MTKENDKTVESIDDGDTGSDQTLFDLDGEDDTSNAADVNDDDSDSGDAGDDDTSGGKTRTVSEAEYDLMTEKAGIVDLISRNPALAEYVGTTLRNGINNPPGEPDVSDNDDDLSGADIANHPAFKALEKRVERAEMGSKAAAAAAQVMSFGQENPDMVNYQTEITALVQNNGMDLPTAYKYAKALAGVNGTAPNARTSAAEGKGRASQDAGGGEENEILSAARAKINDPKRRVSIGDAMDIAWPAATAAFEE